MSARIVNFMLMLALAAPRPALAETLTFTPLPDGGSLSCSWPLPGLGNLRLADGQAVLNGREIVVLDSTSAYGQARTVLSGLVLKAEAQATARQCTLTGLVYFNAGDYLDRLGDPAAADLLFTQGGTIRGRIEKLEGDSLVVAGTPGARHAVKLSAVMLVRSPRAFIFTIIGRTGRPVARDEPFSAEIESATMKVSSNLATIPAGSVIPRVNSDPLDGESLDFSKAGDILDELEEESDLPRLPFRIRPSMPGFPAKPLQPALD